MGIRRFWIKIGSLTAFRYRAGGTGDIGVRHRFTIFNGDRRARRPGPGRCRLRSERLYIRCLEPARHAFRADEDALSLLQVGQAGPQQHAGMDKHLAAAGVRHDEAEPFSAASLLPPVP